MEPAASIAAPIVRGAPSIMFFEKLAKAERRGGRLARFLASHPDPAQRAARARQQIEKLRGSTSPRSPT